MADQGRHNTRKRRREVVVAFLNVIIAEVLALLAFSAQHQQHLAAAAVISLGETESQKKRRIELHEAQLNYMKNRYKWHDRPQLPLPVTDRFAHMMEDPNRFYSKHLTHMYSWEILALANFLREDIEAPRETRWRSEVKYPREQKVHGGRPVKYDYVNRLVFVLEWLSCGEQLFRAQFDKDYSATSLHEDRYHILRAINRKMKNEIKWPDELERQQLYASYTGIFTNVVGFLDVTEHEISKSKNPDKEHRTYSGKAGTNTMKTLAIINKHGRFIWVDPIAEGRHNDREQWTSCDLYMNPGRYFSPGEKVASDGGFRGDGNLLISYDVLDTPEKVLYNLAFTEVQKGIENAFGRVQMWFPILGVEKKYWTYDEELLVLSVGAATKLHNWMMRIRELDYNAENSERNWFRHLY